MPASQPRDLQPHHSTMTCHHALWFMAAYYNYWHKRNWNMARRWRLAGRGGKRAWHSSPTEGLFVLFLFLAGVTSRDWSIAGTIKCFEGISVISSKYGATALAKRGKKPSEVESLKLAGIFICTRRHKDSHWLCFFAELRKTRHKVYAEFKLCDKD